MAAIDLPISLYMNRNAEKRFGPLRVVSLQTLLLPMLTKILSLYRNRLGSFWTVSVRCAKGIVQERRQCFCASWRRGVFRSAVPPLQTLLYHWSG
jgi:hypothetical protein